MPCELGELSKTVQNCSETVLAVLAVLPGIPVLGVMCAMHGMRGMPRAPDVHGNHGTHATCGICVMVASPLKPLHCHSGLFATQSPASGSAAAVRPALVLLDAHWASRARKGPPRGFVSELQRG